MKIKKYTALLTAILSVGILITGCSGAKTSSTATSTQQATDSAQPKEIRLGYFQSPNGELLAKGEKLLEKKFPGVTIKYVQFDVGRDVNTAMASGSIDIATIGTPPGTNGIVNDLPYKIYYLHDIIGASEALVVKNTSGINSIADVKGKKIATPFGSTSHFSLLSSLKQNNISEKDVTILDMNAQDIIAAWSRGEIDGTYIWQPAQSKLLSDGGKVILTSEDVAKKGAVTGEFGIVSNDFASKYPEVVKAYIDILDEATKSYKTQSDDVVKTLSAELGLSVDETKQAMNQISVLDKSQQTQYIGTADKQGTLPQILKDTSDFLLTQKAVTASPDVETFKKAVRNDLYK
ncbi:glycine betaine ABC transporter substrate-binding protein [Clostridium chromiireducens]|uniref:Taurine ABC transporter substrate-binding protein n=1 Tax=Clostridium chromiireducens TaxID=225345 RepID=A0A1V4ILK8_9CLOT|nr:glycine betaine ABC transporter substrate-binding protein [Clostridium chromiireducens]OPJ60816.1 taurine-binding periplasmic protein precursor [Clostridium chromiireducens]RII33194.1 taurine ABC transporter substrate-binding protein [Clostridium chromiireducens]